jgi:hypothetical protein
MPKKDTKNKQPTNLGGGIPKVCARNLFLRFNKIAEFPIPL